MKYAKLSFYLTLGVLVTYVNGKALTINCYDTPGYYWRDYIDEVPNDAVPGGTDVEGKTTYVGQTVHGGSVLPGKISENQRKIFYEFGGGEQTKTEDVKILCSQHPEQLEWISVKIRDPLTYLGKDKHFVLGGHDRSRPLAIGRKTIETGEVTVAKVLIEDNKFQNIFLSNNGKGWSDNGPYEILVYNPPASLENQKNCLQKVYNLYLS